MVFAGGPLRSGEFVVKLVQRRGLGSQILQRINCTCALADFKMHLRSCDRTSLARFCNHCPTFYCVTAFDKKLLVVSISCYPAVFMPNKYEVAVTFQLPTGICNDTGICSSDRGAFWYCDINTFVAQTARLFTEAGDYATLYRPTESRVGCNGWLG